ncbi:MAG TPA: rhomboid family intramembrane serine protease [Amnibacterium sp.]|nr:rhomboid family intramembrane serine protease [Amnibacterium sp.]
MSGVRADARRAWRRSAKYRPRTATGWIIVITVAAYLVELAAVGPILGAFTLDTRYLVSASAFEPWRLLTSVLLHAPVGPGIGVVGLTHIGFNMYAVHLFGRPLENLIGAGRLVALYVLSGLGGSVAVLYWSLFVLQAPMQVYGASGAVFGILGASAVIQRRLGIDVRYLYLLIVINFALAFVVSGIAWQAHVGGLLVGALTGWVFVANRGPRRRSRATLAGAGIGAVLIVLALAPAAVSALTR